MILDNIDTVENEVTNTEVSASLSINDATKYAILLLVEANLAKKNEASTMEELLRKRGIEPKPGEIYGYHILLLQGIFQEDLNLFGLSLQEEVAKTGEQFTLGKLSALEEKLLISKTADTMNLCGVIDRLQKQSKNGQ